MKFMSNRRRQVHNHDAEAAREYERAQYDQALTRIFGLAQVPGWREWQPPTRGPAGGDAR